MLKTIVQIDAGLWEWTGLKAASRFLSQHRLLLGYMALVALLAYPYTLFSFSLSMDSEWHALDSGGKIAWVEQGRWGMYLLNQYLLPDSVIPFFPPFLALAGCIVGAFFLVLTLSPVRSWADYVATPIAIGCPIFYFALYFTTLGYGIGIAFAITAIGLYALTRWSIAGGITAVLFLASSISIYQAILPLIPVIFALYVVASITDKQRLPLGVLLRQSILFIAVLALSYGLYQQVSQALMTLMQLKFDSGYMGGFIQFQPTPEYMTTALRHTYNTGIGYYTGSSQYYINDLPVLKWLFIGSALVVTLRILLASQQGIIVRLLGLCALLCAFAAPLSMLFLCNCPSPPRTLPSVPYVLAGIVFISARSSLNTIRVAVGVLALACFYKFCIINTRYALASQMRWQSDRELSTRIVERMGLLWDKLPAKQAGETYPVALVGELDTERETPFLFVRSVVADSFYAWGGGDLRMVSLWYSMGVFDYFVANNDQYLTIAEEADKMPIWPAPGSVSVIKGIFVIKLSNFTNNQKTIMCQQNTSHPFCLEKTQP